MKKPFVKLTLRYGCNDCANEKSEAFSRKIVVPGCYSLAFLHDVIQSAFGWLDYHLYAFRAGKVGYTIPDPDVGKLGAKEKPAARMAIDKLFKKAGDRCVYEYDFGDGNEVEIVCDGLVSTVDEKDFAAKGQDLVEDSAAFGLTPGIVDLLTKKKRTAKAKECVKWLAEAFDLEPEDVLAVPTANEIAIRVMRLVDFVQNAIP